MFHGSQHPDPTAARSTPRRRMLRALALAALATAASASSAAAAGTWTSATPLPEARGQGAAAARDGVVYAAGGYTASGFSGPFDALTTDTGTWSGLAPLPTPRNGLGLVAARDGRIYAIGGNDAGFGAALATVEAYSIRDRAWTTLAPLPEPRTGVAAAEGSDGRIYVFGGQWQGNGGDYQSSVYAYDPATNTWTTRSSAGFTARYFATAVPLADGRIGVFGGWNNLVGGHLRTAEAYDPQTDTWTTLPPLPLEQQGAAGGRGCDGAAYVVGGYSWAGIHDATSILDRTATTWNAGPTLPAARAYAGGAVTRDGGLYVVGGYNDATGGWTSAVDRLDTAPTGTWCGLADGFERGTLSPRWSATRVTATTTSPLTGTYAARSTSTGMSSYARTTLPVAQPAVYLRAWVRVASQGTKAVTLLTLRSSSGDVISLGRTASGALRTVNTPAARTRTSTTLLPSGQWHALTLRVVTGTGGRVDVWLDGAAITSLSGAQTTGSRPITQLQLGDTGSGKAWSVSYDDVAADTEQPGQ